MPTISWPIWSRHWEPFADMPELLEIETYRKAAEPIVGRTVAVVDAPDDWYLKGGLGPPEVVSVLLGVPE